MKEPKALIIGGIISIVFILILGVSEFCRTNHYLNLEVKWLLVAGIPILIALFIGGYIKEFKGFGFELEANLKKGIGYDFIEKIEYDPAISLEKGSSFDLEVLEREKKLQIIKLKFILKRRSYEIQEIKNYLYTLPNLKYFEIVNDRGQFLYLLNIENFKHQNEYNDRKISQFIKAIMHGNIINIFSSVITDHVSINDKIMDVYKRLLDIERTKNIKILPVLNSKKEMVGVVNLNTLEHKISLKVLKSFEEQNN